MKKKNMIFLMCFMTLTLNSSCGDDDPITQEEVTTEKPGNDSEENENKDDSDDSNNEDTDDENNQPNEEDTKASVWGDAPLTAVGEAVDLGLSVKWADRNIGASNAEAYGEYFAWGETVGKEEYNWKSYLTCLGGNMNSYRDCGTSNDPLYEYVYPYKKSIVSTQYDAATANWGNNWRMPTKDEVSELRNNCTSIWITQNGVYGRKVIGPNGNSIFIPAAGSRYESKLDYVGSGGDYWTVTPHSEAATNAYGFGIGTEFFGSRNGYSRCEGLMIRAVCE